MKSYFKNNIDNVQLLLTVLVWMLLFAVPLMFGQYADEINWNHIFKIWQEYILLFIIFLANRFVLMPHLFFKGKRQYYFASIILLIIIFSAALYFIDLSARPPLEMQPPPPQEGFGPPPGEMIPGQGRPMGPGKPQVPGGFIPPYANMLIISILLTGFDSGLMFFSKWMKTEQTKLKAEKESIANKMAFLQNQVSPHFFMNTLNNIHALIDIDAEEAKDAVIRLSKMMDYMLYESQSAKIGLEPEFDFIKSYVELMKLRYTDDVEVKLELPSIVPRVKIPPLITISLLENAFKYGISYQDKSFIHIKIDVDEDFFRFNIKNPIHKEIIKNKNSGIGIENTRNRLDLLFGKNYTLDIKTENNLFEANLIFPL